MKTISFPSSYKKALLNKTKNTTVRVLSECGRYNIDENYRAVSYTEKDWNITIKVVDIIPTTLDKLLSFDIPKKTYNYVLKNNKIKLNSRIEIIKFIVE